MHNSHRLRDDYKTSVAWREVHLKWLRFWQDWYGTDTNLAETPLLVLGVGGGGGPLWRRQARPRREEERRLVSPSPSFQQLHDASQPFWSTLQAAKTTMAGRVLAEPVVVAAAESCWKEAVPARPRQRRRCLLAKKEQRLWRSWIGFPRNRGFSFRFPRNMFRYVSPKFPGIFWRNEIKLPTHISPYTHTPFTHKPAHHTHP